MFCRLLFTIALLLILAGCSPEPPTTERMQALLEDMVQTTIEQERGQVESTRAGRLMMQFSDLPAADEAKVENVLIRKTEAAQDDNLYVTVSFDVVVRSDTFQETKIVLIAHENDEWVLEKVL